ncbi:hypothetical protein BGZ88_004653 [Linnemannia elongata]|nr:hypothetical protein BGZ88_004653 [Linnemannia elongata]
MNRLRVAIGGLKEQWRHRGLQFQAAAESVLHILVDYVLAFDNIPLSRTISMKTSWHSRMTQEYGVAYCSLRGAESVNKNAIAERMNEIRNICSDFAPDDIYNCRETGMYLKELSIHSYTTEELASDAKPNRGALYRASTKLKESDHVLKSY